MSETSSVTVTPSNQALLAKILRNKFQKRSLFNQACCHLGFHDEKRYECISFCSSCFLIISGDELKLQMAIETAKFQVTRSTFLLANAHNRTFAYEDNCESMRLEDVMTLELLLLVRENLGTNPNRT
jgi:hypothetical protein